MALGTNDRATVLEAMADVARHGKRSARHIRGDIYELRADGTDATFRLLFATEGRFSQVLLALAFFAKTTQKTPERMIKLAERRLIDWRSRGRTGS